MAQRDYLSDHILPASATMVGVCITVITVMQIAPNRTFASWMDKLMALDSLAFLISTFLSYWSIRHKSGRQNIEMLADRAFLLGMVILVVAGFLIAFELFVA